MARFLVDTNTISEPTRKRPYAPVLENLRKYQKEITISTTVLHELIFGCESLPESRKRKDIERYIRDPIISAVPIISYDEKAARWHAVERARLTAIGQKPSISDGQIAAVAAVNGLTLVTRNVSDFSGFEGVNVVNWHE